MIFSTKFNCPSCRYPLALEKKDDTVFLFCSRGSCDSQAANDGKSAENEQEAFKKLQAAIEEEGEE